MIRLYDYLPSGNGYKVRLLLTQLQIPFERIELDIIKGNTRMPGFLSKFPNGRIPAVEFDDGLRLFESNAIIWHFAETTSLVPQDPFERARVLQWMFFEQYSHEPYIAVNRHWLLHLPQAELAQLDGRIADNHARGEQALAVMEQQLTGSEWLAAGRYSIADIALYPYTHTASEGGFDLGAYPGIRKWLDRVRAQPHHLPQMQEAAAEPVVRWPG